MTRTLGYHSARSLSYSVRSKAWDSHLSQPPVWVSATRYYCPIDIDKKHMRWGWTMEEPVGVVSSCFSFIQFFPLFHLLSMNPVALTGQTELCYYKYIYIYNHAGETVTPQTKLKEVRGHF